MITTQILVKNNEETIEKTLDSIVDLDSKILIGDLGCTDRTIDICEKYNVEIKKIKLDSDYSKARNQLVQEGINFYIEPWEILVKGHDLIKSNQNSLNVCVFQNNTISKELRIFKDQLFENPVYESVSGDVKEYEPEIIIFAGSAPDLREERIQICKKWLNSKLANPEPYYYMACSYLFNKQYNEFLSFANQYLIINKKNNISSVILNYYMAQIKFYQNSLQDAARHILYCISVEPALAEFWCLLGDMLYKQKKYEKAKCMYENAIIIGKRRKSDDPYPIEIKKYEEYPLRMINNIQELKQNSNLIGQKKVL